jgi:hypothetical protein
MPPQPLTTPSRIGLIEADKRHKMRSRLNRDEWSSRMTDFSQHRGYAAMFKKDKLTLGLFFAIESYAGAVPEMNVEQQIETAKLAEAKGFSALFFRDVFLNVPSFGDVGHIYDSWVLMGGVMAQTSNIAMATGSIIGRCATRSRSQRPPHRLTGCRANASFSGLRQVTDRQSSRRSIPISTSAGNYSEKRWRWYDGPGARIFQRSRHGALPPLARIPSPSPLTGTSQFW